MADIGHVKPQAIEEELQKSYLDYAMSVIVARALPDVRDGLKPVHRRILYAMSELGLRSSAKYRKSATVVGEVLGKYHPHGDTAVYDAMVRLAQDFAMRYPLVDGQGNFGSMDGDNAAAMRYTEAKMAKITDEMLADLQKDTVDWQDNYDGSQKEPTVLPAKLPNLLINGTVGIAVGMATNIPPHNLGEVSAAAIHLMDNPEATPGDLMDFIQGPDFPTGGIIYGSDQIREAYASGRGRVDMRARAEIEERQGKGGSHRIVVTEVTYQTNKATLIEKIADLVRSKKILGVSDLRDESDRNGVRVVVDLKRDAYPNKVLNQLYQHTDLQKSFYLNMLALTPELEPRVMNVKDVLQHYLTHRETVVRRRATYELAQAKDRAHILEGLLTALGKIDAVIKTIRASQDKNVAATNLKKKFKLTEVQAKAILEMRLQALAALERKQVEDEYKQLQKLIKELTALLKSQRQIKDVVKEELEEVTAAYADERRTEVKPEPLGKFGEMDLIPKEEVFVTLSAENYVKRLPASTYRTQGRGGKGVMGAKGKVSANGDGSENPADIVEHLTVTDTHATVLFFTNRGRVFSVKAHQVPVASRTSRGTAIVNLIQLAPEEKVTALVSVENLGGKGYLFMATKTGFVKKTKLPDFQNVRASGLIAINLGKGDELKWVHVTSGEEDVLMVTSGGKAIRFSEKDVRPMGRASRGVGGMRVGKDDEIVGVEVVRKDVDLLVATENGLGKRTAITGYPRHRRRGGGVKTANITKKTGPLVAAIAVTKEAKHVLISSASGQVIRIPVDDVPRLSRATQGVRIMRLGDKDCVTTVATA
ncbi:MAG: DNA gyrase subunit A [bacterium]|nr:DNA gyrase subunit A [bacterium]MDZ4247804.1 DNA gyrase subunit A [Patescibacteria group bacterium]